MAFLDMFKKKNIPTIQEEKAVEAAQNVPVENVAQEELKASSVPVTISQTSTTLVSKAPVALSTTPLRNDNSAGSTQYQNRSQDIRWPRNGTDARWLAHSTFFFVYADANFIRSRGAEKFMTDWLSEKQSNNLRRNWFIPQFEINKLTDEERINFSKWKDTYSVRSIQKDYHELFAAISQNKWNIVFLTSSAADSSIIRNCAEESHINIRLYAISDEGLLSQLFIPSSPRMNQTIRVQGSMSRQKQDSFAMPMRIADIHRNTNRPSVAPTTGQSVWSDSNTLFRLREAITSNATSITYSTDHEDYYIKIYTLEMLESDLPEKKAKLMLSRKVDIRGVCWPISCVHNDRGEFVGILVPRSFGESLRDGLLRESTVREHFVGWNKQDMVSLALTILNTLGELHTWNIYFGLLNLATIYIKSKSEIYFTDMDEWQIEGYPVLSDNKLFVPPEMQNEQATLHFYSNDEINYQIAYLLFMLMMPGRMPYVRRNGGTVTESIINQDFAFGMGEGMRSTSRQESSSGFWRFVWDHLSYDLGRDFYQTFAKGGQNSTIGHRLNLEQWSRDIFRYNEYLSHPSDPESLKLFPSTFRRDEKRTFQRCEFCGKEHPTFYFQQQLRVQVERQWRNIPLTSIIGTKRICKTCYHESSEESTPNDPKSFFICAGCGDKIYYTNAAKFKHIYMEQNEGWKPMKWCQNCKEPYEERRCIQCGVKFTVTVGQFRAYGADRLPKRCPSCQRNRVRY